MNWRVSVGDFPVGYEPSRTMQRHRPGRIRDRLQHRRHLDPSQVASAAPEHATAPGGRAAQTDSHSRHPGPSRDRTMVANESAHLQRRRQARQRGARSPEPACFFTDRCPSTTRFPAIRRSAGGARAAIARVTCITASKTLDAMRGRRLDSLFRRHILHHTSISVLCGMFRIVST